VAARENRSGVDDRRGGRPGVGEAREGGGAAGEEGDDAHLDVLDVGEGVLGAVWFQCQIEGAEGGDTEGEPALLEGDQYAAADAAERRRAVGGAGRPRADRQPGNPVPWLQRRAGHPPVAVRRHGDAPPAARSRRPAPPSRIADATGLQRTNLSTVLRGLEQKGLIERRADPGDGRGVTVHTTERGRTNYELVRREWATGVSAAADHAATHLDAALALLTSVESGLARTRPQARGKL
jgi:DNA-binding MarR family transcriptional regulator